MNHDKFTHKTNKSPAASRKLDINKEIIDERCTLKQKLKKLLFPLCVGERSNGLTRGAS